MSAKIFTDEMRAWIAQNVRGCDYAELTRRFNERFGINVDVKKLQWFCYRNGLKSGRRSCASIGWNSEHIDWIREHIVGSSFDELVEMFNRSFNMQVKRSTFKNMCARNGLYNGMRGCNEATRRTQFKPGVASWSKGTKGVLKANSGSFQKGNTPPTYKPVGTLVWDNSHEVWFIKTGNPNKWRIAAHVVWERAHGRKLEPRMYVIHADGDKNNLNPENLVALTQGEWTSLNKNGLRASGDADLTRCGVALVKLRNAIKQQTRGKQQ